MSLKALALSVVAMLANTCLASSQRVNIDSDSRSFVDKHGREVIFHGVNVVYKVDPYIPSSGGFDAQNSLNDKDIEYLKNWGFNFVRLGVMWEAVERSEGVYDDSYLDKVDELINKLGQAGIYTLVDAHQDVFARSICGEGMPDFYVKKLLAEDDYCIGPVADWLLSQVGFCQDIYSFGFRLDENGDPLIEDCQTRDFSQYYTTRQSASAFGALFTNKDGLQDKFISFWDHVAARFANNPYVLGYDPLNEPFPGNPARDPMLFVPGQMDKKYLAPMYSKLFKKYQLHDANQQMWFEPGPFPDTFGFFGGYIFPVGFQTPPGGAIGSDKHVFNMHTYCCGVSMSECEAGEPKLGDAQKCLNWHEKEVGQRANDAQRLGLPMFITEFGACLTEEVCSLEIKQVGDLADKYLTGWAYWQFKTYADLTTTAGTGSEGFWNQDGSLQAWKVKALSRSYLPYSQGRLSHLFFDTNTAFLKAVFAFSAQTKDSETVIFLNKEIWYPKGYKVYISKNSDAPTLRHSEDTEDNYFKINVSELFSPEDGDKISI